MTHSYEVHPMRGPSPTRPARLGLEQLETREVPASNFLAFGAAPGGRPLVEVLRFDGSSLGQFEAFETTFRGGVRAAVAELDGNANTLEVITAPGPGGGPVVRVFQIDLTTLARTELVSFFAFNSDFRGGLNVASGNVAGPDGRQEIIVAADAGGGPRVRVLSFTDGNVFTVPGPLGDFFTLDVGFTGGVRVTAGELDGVPFDGDELVVAAGTTGGPRVRVFRSDGVVLADFFTFRPDFRGGVQVSFATTGLVGRVQIDALALDPSQRNADLNADSRSESRSTSLSFGTSGSGIAIATGFGVFGTGAFATPGSPEVALTDFGDPGLLTPFPPLAVIPYTGPAIGIFTAGFPSAVLV